MYDLIGDIHGHAGELTALLELLGYRKSNGVFSHPSRQVIFLGDFIDRGPRIREVLEIVRPMVLDGKALAVMGNHELNALAYHTPDATAPGEFLRRDLPKNVKQHSQTMKQLAPKELELYLDWFSTLPMWLDLPGVRAVHACWDDTAISAVEAGLLRRGGITEGFLHSACLEGGAMFEPVEVLLKGKEILLPDGVTFFDKEGHERSEVRSRWWLSARGLSYHDYAMQDELECNHPIPASVIAKAAPYTADAKPVFVGHYWLSAEKPTILAPNVACVDYSVAKKGMLCAYRWDGEATLSDEKFVWVKAAT